ncbi:phosphonate metabolism protein/1,5-bisphosphokinase (PRPP-forming) PhnN [Pseudomonas sp. Bc-h]|uniref:phosphonate metabolism protein/1,5-bisphosphokinase (PRPP-forming) PhnN n=1 Tax=Pseudomonas sp. Bc-h TaxID=1943632 RepID=UPI0009DA38BA|nr:phosphonate metabolism protein/1,5-bisphosphokinase (PRPP-forming) PhnN [Pseudomonas sp. Bc-h]OQR31723.1 phosphonate metabolism protein/1,5-bisphosphokinase (PRPP-forming) PhnN [Pseudomonas sp. Bc-h]
MAQGIFFFVVGPSGAGKDSLIEGARAHLGDTGRYVFARRTITRPTGAPGEDHNGVTEAQFRSSVSAGEFLITWDAHGLSYGLPVDLLAALSDGCNVIANGSRKMIRQLAGEVPRLIVVEVTASTDVLAARILARGRETALEARARVMRQVEPLPVDIETIRVNNDGALEQGINAFIHALANATQRVRLRRVPVSTGLERVAYLPTAGAVLSVADYLGGSKVDLLAEGTSLSVQIHGLDSAALLAPDEIGLSEEAFVHWGVAEGAEIALRRTPSPASRQALIQKVQGHELGEAEYEMLLRDIIEGRYTDGEISAFLVSATRSLSDAEVIALARVRSRFTPTMKWDRPIVVDKHSMGGVPGSRITLLVVPIVAAHGMAMPKTSSRAITSAAGTADAMESVARVDLTTADVQRCVDQAGACIAWNGRLNHSVVDDVMNAITRPLGLDSNRWSVASILSKKLTAGSTHVVVDLPYGPRTKLKTQAQARELGDLFERVGAGLGLTVVAFATDGSRPIGRGIGPSLEVRDVLAVLANDPTAPQDLRDKAVFFAGQILAWDPAVGSVEAGSRLAEKLLASGEAHDAFERIIDAQGRRTAVLPGALTYSVCATAEGQVSELDGWRIGEIARRAGAPADKSAGIDLKVGQGDRVTQGQCLYVIHGSNSADLESASVLAQMSDGVKITRLP